MLRIVWTEPALGDIRAINQWLLDQSSPEIAARMLGAIRARGDLLEEFPRAGRPHGADQRVLRAPGTPYLIRYRIVGEEVQVLRVHHDRQDWTAL